MWHVLAGCVQADADTRQPDPHAQAKMMAVDPLPQHDATMEALAFAHMVSRQADVLPQPNFLETTQEGTIKAKMRQRLADWMLDVCELFEVATEVFSLSMMLLDRYMSTVKVDLARFQLIGATTLLIISKLTGPIAIRVPALCTCMENAFTVEQVKAQELAILDEVDWNLEHYNPHGFLERFLAQLTVPDAVGAEQLAIVKRHAHVFIDMCYSEYTMVQHPSIVIAGACLYCALAGAAVTGDPACRPDQFVALPDADRDAYFGIPGMLGVEFGDARLDEGSVVAAIRDTELLLQHMLQGQQQQQDGKLAHAHAVGEADPQHHDQQYDQHHHAHDHDQQHHHNHHQYQT